MEHNLFGTINLLEYCKSHKAGLILLSTSRVYSASELAALPVKSSDDRFELQDCDVSGASSLGISEDFPTTAPLSLYGASKLASETLILEYGNALIFLFGSIGAVCLPELGNLARRTKEYFLFGFTLSEKRSPSSTSASMEQVIK